jgi:hypothetical protein
MNALELANELEKDINWIQDGLARKWIVDMLRQQQAEIEALKKDNKELHAIAQGMAMAESDARKSLQWFKDAKERQSEPVAWMYQDDEGRSVAFYRDTLPCGAIPLYTHPAKELTDEEIKSEAKYFCHSYHTENPERLVLFARAILRKAQEK